jgi:hypothetical protein
MVNAMPGCFTLEKDPVHILKDLEAVEWGGM